MRNFVILLLLLNLVYLAWNTGFINNNTEEAPEVNSPVRQSNAENSLSLVSEAALVSELIRKGVAEIEPNIVIDSAVGGGVGNAVDGAVVEGAIDNPPELLSNTTEELDSELSEVLAGRGKELSTLICSSVGFFDNSAAADALAQELSGLGFTANVGERVNNVRQNYWLHMPPFNSVVAARRQLDQLRESNIDSYIITEEEGELAQGISLGLFAQLESAVTLQAQYTEQGFPSSISEVFRSNVEFWIDLEALSEPEFAVFSSLEQLNANQELKVEEKLCETIAPEL